MTNHHHHVAAGHNRAFAFGIGLNVIYILVEVIFGVFAGSLALLADAGHNLSDVLGLLLAWGAANLSSLKPSQRRTYGWRTSSILAALLNGLILLVAVGGIVWEAIRRFYEPQPVVGSTVIWVASIGVIINGLTAMLFLRGREFELTPLSSYVTDLALCTLQSNLSGQTATIAVRKHLRTACDYKICWQPRKTALSARPCPF